MTGIIIGLIVFGMLLYMVRCVLAILGIWEWGEQIMAEYHVRYGIAAIYAGTMKSKDEWRNKSEVTNEAIMAVAQFMHSMMPKDEKKFGYTYMLRNGKRLRLAVEVLDEVTT